VGFLTEQLVKDLEDQVVLFKRLKTAVLRITDPDDWQDFEDKPYLKDSGVQKVRTVARVSFGQPVINCETGEDSSGKFARYVCMLSGTWRGELGYDIGTASSRDPFFGRANGKDLAFDDVRIEDVMKKSVTNAQHRVLTKLLGLSGLTWKQLAEAGIIKGTVGKVGFKSRGQGVGEWTDEKAEFEQMLAEMCGGDLEEMANVIEKRTAWKNQKGELVPGKRGVREMTEKQIAYHLPRLRKAYEEFVAHQGDASDTLAAAASPKTSTPTEYASSFDRPQDARARLVEECMAAVATLQSRGDGVKTVREDLETLDEEMLTSTLADLRKRA